MKNLLHSSRLALVLAALATSAFSQTVSLDTFDLGSATGGVLAGSSWEGNVTFNATSIAIGGTAQDDNGWGVFNVPFDATDMTHFALTAQLGEGHDAATFFTIQFEDWNLNTSVLVLNTSDFSSLGLSTVFAPVIWSDGFDFANITGWTIGGGQPAPGALPFMMTLEDMYLTSSPIPEPGTYALWMGAAISIFALARRRSRAAGAGKSA